MMDKNLARISAGEYLTATFEDMIHPKPPDTRTGAEIAADIIKKAGLKLVTSR